MSNDSTAFLAGCAITGVAAVLLLRGGLIPDQSRGVQPVPPPPAMATPLSPDNSLSERSTGERSLQDEAMRDDLRRQEDLTDDLREQLERQQQETDDLREQLERQQQETENLVSQLQQQLQDQQRIIDAINVQQQLDAADQSRVAERLWMAERQAELSQPPPSPSNTNIQSTVLWVIGVTLIVVALGGGVILVLIVILLVQSQRRQNTPSPMPLFPPHMPPYTLNGQPLLPVSPRPRRTMPVEYYED